MITLVLPLNDLGLCPHCIHLTLDLLILENLVDLQVHTLQPSYQFYICCFEPNELCILFRQFCNPIVLSSLEFDLSHMESVVVYFRNVYC